MQYEIYDTLICGLQNPVVEQKYFDVDFLRAHYPDVMEVLTFHGLDKLMALKVNYSPELVNKFFTTIYFHKDEVRTMTWMSAGQEITRTLADFATLLGFVVPDAEDSNYRRIHDVHKGVLAYHPTLHMAYPEGCGARDAPSMPKMNTKYHLLNKVFCHTIAIKQGDKGYVHAIGLRI
jgi:hypothetical protein